MLQQGGDFIHVYLQDDGPRITNKRCRDNAKTCCANSFLIFLMIQNRLNNRLRPDENWYETFTKLQQNQAT